MQSQVSPMETDNYHVILLICEVLKKTKPNRNRLINTDNKPVVARGRGWEDGQNG